MAETSGTLHRLLMLSPKELQKTLKQSADLAQRLAVAFGLKVPTLSQ